MIGKMVSLEMRQRPEPSRRRRGLSRRQRRNLLVGLLFISPWLVGFLAFLLYPILYSIRMSFSYYNGLGPMEWSGLANYRRLLEDELFWKSLYNTVYYTVFSVPIGVASAMIFAIAMNQDLPEVPVYRAALYLPSVLPLFAVSFVFLVLLNPQYGLINYLMVRIGLPSINWLGDPVWAKITIVGLAQLGAGNIALVFLAGLRAIPQTLYEAAEIEGAGTWRKFWGITLPLMTPVILYDTILGVSHGLQVFTESFILTQGGPNNSTLFYVYYLYNNAFRYGDLGYAAALSWVLFALSFVVALLIFRWSNRWVHYEIM